MVLDMALRQVFIWERDESLTATKYRLINPPHKTVTAHWNNGKPEESLGS